MMKVIILWLLISVQQLTSYPNQRCYFCEQNSCVHPSPNDIKHCSDSTSSGNDMAGKNFVSGALNETGSSDIYVLLASNLITFGKTELNLNETSMPKWESLTRWVCYVSKDKRRGCLVMSKGLCEEKKNWLAQIGSLGSKLTSILAKAKEAVNKMFTDTDASKSLTDIQKGNISDWFAEQYMSKLVSKSSDPQYQLDTCCEDERHPHLIGHIHKEEGKKN